MFSASDVLDVTCVHDERAFQSATNHTLMSAGRHFGFRPTNLWMRGQVVECGVIDDAFLENCAALVSVFSCCVTVDKETEFYYLLCINELTKAKKK